MWHYLIYIIHFCFIFCFFNTFYLKKHTVQFYDLLAFPYSFCVFKCVCVGTVLCGTVLLVLFVYLHLFFFFVFFLHSTMLNCNIIQHTVCTVTIYFILFDLFPVPVFLCIKFVCLFVLFI